MCDMDPNNFVPSNKVFDITHNANSTDLCLYLAEFRTFLFFWSDLKIADKRPDVEEPCSCKRAFLKLYNASRKLYPFSERRFCSERIQRWAYERFELVI
jgi:hypothetical protein